MRQTSGARVAASEFYRSEIHHRNWSDAALLVNEDSFGATALMLSSLIPPPAKGNKKGTQNSTTTTTTTITTAARHNSFIDLFFCLCFTAALLCRRGRQQCKMHVRKVLKRRRRRITLRCERTRTRCVT